ncbi:MAG TPA: class I SAM-dependent methyltransferase [Candidatus Nitrosotenuis sp.]|nr:class I SAM-dependent methyltransferase [Candidatus Nitrosotenuis sp.]
MKRYISSGIFLSMHFDPMVRSPLTNSSNVALEREIDCETIIKIYKGVYKIDVARFFKGLTKVQLFRCLDTGYRFYYPFSVGGDSEFYEALQQLSWYYMDWKWEHEIARNLIKEGDKILEIGCGHGAFLKRISNEYKIKCVGLELNHSAILSGKQKGLMILNERIENHALQNPQTYDIVCVFQVVEHIADIKGFLEAAINALKSGGKLIISVPNNDSFIRYARASVLNMPPHHMGLWNRDSLAKLQDFFPLQLLEVHFEPLQPQHYSFYISVQLSRIFSRFIIVNKIIDRLLNPFASILLRSFSKKIIGHTVLVVYKKL